MCSWQRSPQALRWLASGRQGQQKNCNYLFRNLHSPTSASREGVGREIIYNYIIKYSRSSLNPPPPLLLLSSPIMHQEYFKMQHFSFCHWYGSQVSTGPLGRGVILLDKVTAWGSCMQHHGPWHDLRCKKVVKNVTGKLSPVLTFACLFILYFQVKNWLLEFSLLIDYKRQSTKWIVYCR